MRGYVADHQSSAGVSMHDLSAPEPGPGVAVVTVAASSLNRGEVQHVRRFHFVPHGERVGWDVAGTVTASATDGTGPPVGTRVFGWCRDRGAWAEQVAVPVTDLAATPEALSPVDASTLGVAALTAYAAISRIRRPLSSASVLVAGATGGVGLFAAQLALAAGASVTASVRRAEDAAYVQDVAGREVSVEVGLDPNGPPADLVVDPVGGNCLANALRRVATGGTVVSIARSDDADALVPSNWFLKGARLDGIMIWSALEGPEIGRALSELASHVVAGTVRCGVDRVLPAEELPAAMALLIDRKVRGKVVVTWDATQAT